MPIAIDPTNNRSLSDVRSSNRVYNNNHSDSKSNASNNSYSNLHSNSSNPHWDSTHPKGHNPSPSPTLMGTDDESSSASIRHWPRTKGSTGPSPLGGGSTAGSSSSIGKNGLASTFSFLSSDKLHGNDSSTKTSASAPGAPSQQQQLRVKNLERDLSYSGYLTKFSSRTFFSRKQWKRRYFILYQKSLHCFKSSDPQHTLLESLTLCSATVVCVTDAFAGKRYCLEISCPGEKSWFVLADTATEMSGWLRELKGTVNRFRNVQLDSRPGTMYSSDSLALSDTSSSSTAVRIPSVPALPGQFDKFERDGQVSHPFPLSTGQSLSPPPRSITPKPQLLSIQSSDSTSSNSRMQPTVNEYQSSQQQQQHRLQSQPQSQQQSDRRRRGSSVSTAPTVNDYASFGSVMEKAEALAAVQRNSPSSTWSLPTKSGVQTGSTVAINSNGINNFGTVPRSKRDSTMSTVSNMSIMSSISSMASAQSHAYYRSSVMVDLDRSGAGVSNSINSSASGRSSRNSQRTSTAPSVRAMSPVPSSRPLSPTFNRTSPRNSLVIAPPPRSIHRPVSVSLRHSTQILPLPQNAASGLPSQTISTRLNTQPPRAGLPVVHEGQRQQQAPPLGDLSRITSIRHQRDIPSSRQSMVILPSEQLSGPRIGSGSLQERVQRSSSRASIMAPTVSTTSPSSRVLMDSRPLSPAPLTETAPKVPLPEPPRSGSNSPSRAATIGGAVPRHHSPDLTVPVRSQARSRSQSQEAASISTQLDDLSLSRRATSVSPASPRMSALMTAHQKSNGVNNSSGATNSSNTGSSRQMSLPINSMYVLPAPPTHQAPTQPPVARGQGTTQRTFASGGNTPLRPLSMAVGSVPSLGGGIARRSVALSASISSSNSKRDSVLSPRLSSALISLPPEPTKAVPLPPTQSGDFPAPPTGALPSKPRVKQERTTLKGIGAIVEEEDEEDEDEDDEEFESNLEFEELVAAKEADEKEQQEDDDEEEDQGEGRGIVGEGENASGTRPEYYATKERKVVEYIFPSESLSA
ncbi:hypothetical protein BGZ83_008590 [Gryganskiella cystojenkinii]|nr:hypothetical protein BGZ83_008590 [Gryganskiella cystojenkinii]